MTNPYKEHVLIQTFVELDSQISNLTRFVHSQRFLEFGDDPHLIEKFESVLVEAHSKVKSIESFFDLDVTPLREANVYFALIRDINETLRYLREVRKKQFGSRQQTRELVDKLENCANSIYAIGNLLKTNAEIIQ